MNKKPNWSYTGKTGPQNWGTLCSEFKIAALGCKQSPINIIQEQVVMDQKEIDIHYEKGEFRREMSRYTFNLIAKEKSSFLSFDNKKYYLDHIHIHIPSEHTYNNNHYAMEWHFVHIGENQKLLVLGVWVEIDKEKQSSLKTLFDNIKVIFDPTILIGKNNEYYTYEGSLTTPPTREDVLWIIQRTATTISLEDFEFCKSMVSCKNNRPIQNQNQRIVRSIKKNFLQFNR